MLNKRNAVSEKLATAALMKHGYTLIKTIGCGGFSTVYLAKSMKYNKEFAVKQVRPSQSVRLDSALSELRTIMSLTHPNIIQVYDYFIENSNLYLVLEYCSGGSLQDMIDKSGVIPEDRLLQYLRGIVQSMAFLQSQNIAHHDIKPGNIFIDSHDRVKFGDFGISINVHQDTENGLNHSNFDGSLQFMAPEVILKEAYDPFCADIWSLGITIYYMLCGKLPWVKQSKEELKMRIIEGDIKYPDTMKQSFVNLLKKMLVVDFKQRITISDLLDSFIFDKLSLNMNTKSTSNLLYGPTLSKATTRSRRGSFLMLTSSNINNNENICKEENEIHVHVPRAFKHSLHSEMLARHRMSKPLLNTFVELED